MTRIQPQSVLVVPLGRLIRLPSLLMREVQNRRTAAHTFQVLPREKLRLPMIAAREIENAREPSKTSSRCFHLERKLSNNMAEASALVVLQAQQRLWCRSLWSRSGPELAAPREARIPVPRGRDVALPAPRLQTWVDTMPKQYQPYLLLARADKPIGTWLLLWPCCWSIALVAPAGHFPDVLMLSKFALGALVMRGAGCTINDMWDTDIDRKVERTKTRPLASGALSHVEAAGFLGLQLTAGLGVLLSLNTYSIVLGASSLLLVVAYPLMKRVTHFPQLVLGLTFNWGALLGASAVLGYTPLDICLPLYFGSVCWTLAYDTIYAHQDKTDDAKVGVKSTALYLGEWTKAACSACAACFAAGLVAAGQAAGMGFVYHAAVGLGSLHLLSQILRVDLNRPADCLRKFVSNKWLGALIFAGIVADKLYR